MLKAAIAKQPNTRSTNIKFLSCFDERDDCGRADGWSSRLYNSRWRAKLHVDGWMTSTQRQLAISWLSTVTTYVYYYVCSFGIIRTRRGENRRSLQNARRQPPHTSLYRDAGERTNDCLFVTSWRAPGGSIRFNAKETSIIPHEFVAACASLVGATGKNDFNLGLLLFLLTLTIRMRIVCDRRYTSYMYMSCDFVLS